MRNSKDSEKLDFVFYWYLFIISKVIISKKCMSTFHNPVYTVLENIVQCKGGVVFLQV